MDLGIKDVVKIWPDVLDESLDEKMAPALYEVFLGVAARIYSDPYEFFRRTFLSDGMRRVFNDILGSLSGGSGINIIPLLSLFGGGKTHTLIAIYHAFRNPDALRGLDSGLASKISALGNVIVVVLDCESDSLVPNPGAPVEVDGVTIRTIWGMLAYRLGKYDVLGAEDSKILVPSVEKLRRLFVNTKAIVLVDEIVKYAHRFINSGNEQLRRYGRAVVTFVENLAKAIEGTNSVLVITLPIEITERGGREEINVERAYEDIAQSVLRAIRRVSSKYEAPLAKEDIVKVLKRRIFSEINTSLVNEIRSEFFILYNQDEMLKNIDFSRYRAFEDYYPFHPAYIDVLYDIVTRVPELQKTRDALKITRKVVRALWNSDANPTFIMPWHIDVRLPSIRSDIVTVTYKSFSPVIEKDLLDRIPNRSSKPELAYYVALVVFLRTYTYPPSAKVSKVFPDKFDVLFMVYDPNTFNRNKWRSGDVIDILEELYSSVSFYLQRENDRYWFTPYRSIIEIIEEEAKNISDSEAMEKLVSLVEELYVKSLDALIRRRRKSSTGYTPTVLTRVDPKKTRVVLEAFDYVSIDEKKYILVVSLSSLDKDDLERLVYFVRPDRERKYRNTIVVMFPSSDESVRPLLRNVKQIIAAERIDKSRLKELYAEEEIIKIQEKKVSQYKESKRSDTFVQLLQVLNRLAFPLYDEKENRETVHVISTSSALTNLVGIAEKTLKSPTAGKIPSSMSCDYFKVLFEDKLGIVIDESFSKVFGEIVDFFYTNPKLPFATSDMVAQAIKNCVERLDLGVIRGSEIYWKKIFWSKKEAIETDVNVPRSLRESDLVVHWTIAAARLINKIKNEIMGSRELPSGELEVTSCFLITARGDEFPIEEIDVTQNFDMFADIIRESKIICEKKRIKKGILVTLEPRNIRVKPGEEIKVKVKVKAIGEFSGAIRLSAEEGELTVSEGELPLESIWVLKAPHKAGHYEFRIVAEAPELGKSEGKLFVIVVKEAQETCVNNLSKDYLGWILTRIECSDPLDLKAINEVFRDKLSVKSGYAKLRFDQSKINLTFEDTQFDIAYELLRDAINYVGGLMTEGIELSYKLIPKSKIVIDEFAVDMLSNLTKTVICIKREEQ